MSKEAVIAVTHLIDLGMIAQEDIVKCLTKAISEPEPARQPLTDEQIEQLEQDTCAMDFPETVRAIEAAHGIKGEA